MPSRKRTKDFNDDAMAYLSVDRFMATMIQGRALAAAFEIGLVDCLISRGPASAERLTERLSADLKGMTLLLATLAESGVVENREGVFSLGASFVEALHFREFMELKLTLSNIAARDFLDGFADLAMGQEKFMRQARFHRLFAYDRCFGTSREDRQITEQWMRITTIMTRYESAVCMCHHDFSGYRRMLDVGGNSGEFALRLCRSHPDLQAVVFDLPLVCEVGGRHVAGEPEADRISFVKGNALAENFPAQNDLITFKSMLHDWPDPEARHLIEKAARSLNPGGRVLIFERALPASPEISLNYAMIPFLIFFHSYRSPEIYSRCMKSAGFSDIRVKRIDLEMPFMLVTGRWRG